MNARQTLPPTPDFILIKGDVRTIRSSRPIALSPTAPAEPTPAVMTARRMVAACRENVRFLNHRLSGYGRWIDLPPVIGDVLYLGYSVRVKDTAPFSAAALRRHLAEAGIETAAKYSFISQSTDVIDADTICLPCHHTVSILDLQYMVDTLAGFLAPNDLKTDAIAADE
jgi:hypothetical protein